MRSLAGSLRPLLAPLLAGPAVGVAWWLLAPTAPVRVLGEDTGGGLVVASPSRPELGAAQDGTFLLLALLAGLVTGVVVAVRHGPRPTSAVLLAALGALAGSVVAVWLGQALGPVDLLAQGAAAPVPGATTGAPVRDGSDGALVSPLGVHARGVLLVWPLVTLLAAAVVHLLAVRAPRAA